MAKGKSRIHRPLLSGDTRATMDCLRALGVSIHEGSGEGSGEGSETIDVDSPGTTGWKKPDAPLNAGNSGTTARFLMGVLSACPGMQASIIGDASLSRRPMRRVLDLLHRAGAPEASHETGEAAQASEKSLPVTIRGAHLQPFDVQSAVGSAQIKTAMIFAALTCDGESRVTLPDGSRNHTEILCAKLGLPVTASRGGGLETITIHGPADIRPFEVTVPGDPSSAAFLVAAGILSGQGIMIRGVCGNPLRSAFIDVLDQAGLTVQRTPVAGKNFTEAVEDWSVSPGSQSRLAIRPAGEIPAAWAPAIIDEIPVLAVVLAFAPGASVFRGVGELRFKESDRLAATVELLQQAGCKAVAEGDDLLIAGGLKPATIKPFEFDPKGDHRLAMAAMVLEFVAQKACTILDRSCVEVSFPDFTAVLSSVDSKHSKKRGLLS